MNFRGYTFNDLPIRYKLVIHFLMIGIIPAILLGWMVHFTVNKIISKQVNEQSIQLISKTNKSLESYVNEIQNMTYYISFHPTVQNFLQANQNQTVNVEQRNYEISSFLQGFTTLRAEVAGILVVNAHNEYVSNEFIAKQAVDLTTESWYKQAEANRGIFQLIGQPDGRHLMNYAAYTDNEVVTVVRAILDPSTQETLGVILIDLKLRIIAETLKDLRLGKTGFLMLVDDQGQIIYAPNSPITPYIQAHWFTEDVTGNFFKVIGEQHVQFMCRKSNFTNWSVVGVFSTNESVEEISEIRFYLISFIFLAIFLGVTASYFLSHTISRPILRLTHYMGKVESGDLGIRSMEKRNDEIGILSREFNKMLSQISKLISLVETKERQKRESELRVLHANIKPHFLYNTLDTIQWLAKEKGATEVSGLVDALSTFFRIGLSKGKEIISFRDEIEHVNSYLKIQQTRYSHKLEHDIHVHEGMQSCLVLKLILQPIVENAIYHGIKERRGIGHIRIEAIVMDQVMVIQVIDDGIGISEDKLQQLQKQLDLITPDDFKQFTLLEEHEHELNELTSHGYGLINVQSRLRYTFGLPYGLQIHSKLHQGTTVTITHPLITDEKRSLT